MKVQLIYVDTSVIGGRYDEEFAPWSNGLMTDFRLGIFRPAISEIVAIEVADAPQEVQEQYVELTSLPHEFIEITDAATELANRYLEHAILSPNYFDDAQHIALATVAEVDLLVSWNFRHMVHFDKIRQFNAINLAAGYKEIEIRSPREVTSHGPEEKDV